MQAVILVGGLGTRLRPITYDVPKALVPLRNRPFMGYMLDFLRNGGLDGAVLSLGYLPTPIQEYLAGFDLAGFSVDYAVEEHALGTAGGIKNAARFLREEGSVVAVNGDVLSGTDLKSLIERHKETEALATITLTSVEDPTAYGLVEVDHDMVVRRFIEKPAADEVTIEREIFPELQALGRLRAHVSSSYWRDIGTPRSYLAACHDVLSGAVGAPREGFEYCDVDGTVRKGKNVKLFPPVSVAAGGEIASLATVGGRSALGRGCRVGAGAVVEGSILLEGAEVEAGAVVRGSIIGKGARVGQDAIVRGLSVLGAGCVVGEGNVLDQGIRVNPGVVLPPRSLRF